MCIFLSGIAPLLVRSVFKVFAKLFSKKLAAGGTHLTDKSKFESNLFFLCNNDLFLHRGVAFFEENLAQKKRDHRSDEYSDKSEKSESEVN